VRLIAGWRLSIQVRRAKATRLFPNSQN